MRTRVVSLFLSFVLGILLAGCDQAAIVDKIATQEEQAFVRQQVEHLRARRFKALEASLDKSKIGPDARETLEKMAAVFPAGEPRSVEIVGVQKLYRKNGTTELRVTIEYGFADRWLLARLIVPENGGNRTVTGFHVYPRVQSLAQENRLTLAGKGPAHYFFLAAALAAFGVTVWALVACIRTRGLRRKWLWIPFILLGVGQFALNWTSGTTLAQPLFIQVFSASLRAQLGDPWVVSVSIPLGAIAFLLLARRRRRQASAVPA